MWTDLGDGIRVRRSRAWAMNSVVLADPAHAVLVDPGVLPSELDDLAVALDATRPARVTLLLTHSHWDHVIGRTWWPAAPVVAHAGLAAEVRREAPRILDEAARCAREHGETWDVGFEPFRPQIEVAPASRTGGVERVELGPWGLELREARGHCDDQLTALLPDRGLLLAADLLSDLEIPWLNGPVAIHRATIEGLTERARAGAFDRLVPGHGSPALGRDAVRRRLDDDLDYLERLARAAVSAHERGLPPEEALRELEGMEFPGREDPARFAIHRSNVPHAWREVSAAASRS